MMLLDLPYQSEHKNPQFILNENDIQNNISKVACPIELLYGLNNAFGMEEGVRIKSAMKKLEKQCSVICIPFEN
jgi:hypothetical protein